jgi:hypothetical protein
MQPRVRVVVLSSSSSSSSSSSFSSSAAVGDSVDGGRAADARGAADAVLSRPHAAV